MMEGLIAELGGVEEMTEALEQLELIIEDRVDDPSAYQLLIGTEASRVFEELRDRIGRKFQLVPLMPPVFGPVAVVLNAPEVAPDGLWLRARR